MSFTSFEHYVKNEVPVFSHRSTLKLIKLFLPAVQSSQQPVSSPPAESFPERAADGRRVAEESKVSLTCAD